MCGPSPASGLPGAHKGRPDKGRPDGAPSQPYGSRVPTSMKSWLSYCGRSASRAFAWSTSPGSTISPCITPRSRMRRVIARVSTPASPGAPWERRYASTVTPPSGWLGRSQSLRTTSPRTWMRALSSVAGITP